MLQYFDFSITKSSTCDLTICDLIDTQSAPTGDNEITYDLLIPGTQTSEIASITSIEVEKFNACDSSFTPVEYTILPLNEEAGAVTYNLSIGTGQASSDEEQLIWTNTTISTDLANITKYVLEVKRSGSTIHSEEFTTPGTTHTTTLKEAIGQEPTFLAVNDTVVVTVYYTNGVTTSAVWNVDSIGAGSVGDPTDPSYASMTVDSSNVYTLDASDCLELVTDLDSFGDWDGIWSVRLKVNYTDANGDNRHIITTRCGWVDCDSECDAVKEIASLLSTDTDKAYELALVKQMIDYSMECSECCAACDALDLYNNRIKGNCTSC